MPLLEYFAAGLVAVCAPNPDFGLYPQDVFVPKQYCVVQVCGPEVFATYYRHEIIGDSFVLFRTVECHTT